MQSFKPAMITLLMALSTVACSPPIASPPALPSHPTLISR